ncbi:ATP-binding cassette domain-containing protein [Mycobacterium sp. NPDC050551]|uniref:ATP-binding cassette domain-containing protein n=1 Tax=Mycobacterium sp. NPDC050551 TaxID=3155407 RepID=UPI003423DF64
MSPSAVPTLTPTITVCSAHGRHTFAPGQDVVIGRDVRADVRIPHPKVSRSHVVLRHLDESWVAVDDTSLHGIYADGRRVQSVEVRGGQTIHLVAPDGPQLRFELGAPASPADAETTRMSRQPDRQGSLTIGRTPDNDIVVPDVLASRHHATLIATDRGVRLSSIDGRNGTFVNGERITDTPLADDDIVTIGNVDFVFTAGVLVRRTQPAATTGGLEVNEVSLAIERDTVLLDRITFTARPGTLTAVIGPSGSGKSTLAKTIVGAGRPTSGTVSFEGRDLNTRYAALRSRIGMVPQDDIVHGRLTVAQALDFAAELRMPADTAAEDRRQVIAAVLEELELAGHADTRIDTLSGGQRKRVSVALELLTGPSLLVLDEPTTGLDPALDRAVMGMLRRLADAGRVIVVVTHSLSFLDVCDQVLLLAPGGKTAFCGPPDELGPAMGSTDWADIFTGVCADPDGAQRRFLAGRELSAASGAVDDAPMHPVTAAAPSFTGLRRQVSTIARREVRLLMANRGYLVFLAVLPFIVGLLPLTVAGGAGLGGPPPDGAPPFEAKHVIALTSFAAILMGVTLTVRDLVGERAIFQREQAAGLSASAYLLAKIAVFGAVAVIQSAILVLVVTAPGFGKPAPSRAVVLGSPMLEFFAGIAATAVAAAVLGLAVSALARTGDQVIVLLAATLMAQLVLAGGFIPVTGRPLFETLAWITPGRWGFAATASTADLSSLVAGIADDPHWQHTPSRWLFDMAMLAVLTVLFAAIARWRLRLKVA